MRPQLAILLFCMTAATGCETYEHVTVSRVKAQRSSIELDETHLSIVNADSGSFGFSVAATSDTVFIGAKQLAVDGVTGGVVPFSLSKEGLPIGDLLRP